MAGVILILGLIAAGIYTEHAAFYWVAGTVGVFHLLLQIMAIGTMKMVKTQLENSRADFAQTPLRVVGRKATRGR